MFPGAVLVAYGPATGENDTIYVLSTQGKTGTISTYVYHNAEGSIVSGQSFDLPSTVEGMVVDLAKNLILSVAGTEAGGYLLQVAPGGLTAPVTTPFKNGSTPLALDYHRNLFYVDGSGLEEVMKGAVNFGGVQIFLYDVTEYAQQTLRFALSPGLAATATINYTGMIAGDFFDNYSGRPRLYA